MIESTRSDDFETINSSFTKDSYSPTLSTSSSSNRKSIDVFDLSILSESSKMQRQACQFVIQWYMAEMDKDFTPIVNGEVVDSWKIIQEILTDKVSYNSYNYRHKTLAII